MGHGLAAPGVDIEPNQRHLTRQRRGHGRASIAKAHDAYVRVHDVCPPSTLLQPSSTTSAVPVRYEVSSKASNSTALPTVIMATLPWMLMMSPDIRCSGNRRDEGPLYHFCAPTRQICSGRSRRRRHCLEPGLCGAGRSTKLLLTRAI